jgi:putative heme-binding domain-containing protein
MSQSHRIRLVCLFASSVWALTALGAAQEQHPGEYSPAEIENGARLYTAQCVTCHGATGDGVGGVDLRRGTFRRAASDEDIKRVVATGIEGTMPKFDFSAAEQNGLVAYIRSGFSVKGRAVKIGDAARGKTVYETKGACATCHRVSGTGTRKGPDLTDIGSLRTPSMLQQTLNDPSEYLLPINRPVRATTRDGKVVAGRRLNEDTYSVQILDESGRLVTLLKADLKELQVMTTSQMPSVRGKLTSDEVSDLIAYLISLKG